MKPSLFTKLSLMMFLEYFVWGAWYVTMGTYMTVFLKPSEVQISAAYGALAIATMISPFLVGMVADKYFAAQRIMGVLHLLGGILLYTATTISSNGAFYWIILIYSILYMPTIALSNNIAFSQMSDPGKQFPWIRVFGTAGWIVAGTLITAFSIELTTYTFKMAAIASVVLGLGSFALPETPPKAKGSQATFSTALGADAFVLFRDRPYLIFFITSILICIPLAFYYNWANVFLNEIGLGNVAVKMTFGQISEALFILAIPFLFNRIGVKNMLVMGIGAWVLRYILFAFGNVDANVWMLYAGIILHGVCYDFFFVTGYMYTEKKAGDKIKNAAQGLFTFATYGAGMFIGTSIAGIITRDYRLTEKLHDWQGIWLVTVYIGAAVLLSFMLIFREQKEIKPAA